jgi:hypothetical protein
LEVGAVTMLLFMVEGCNILLEKRIAMATD